MLSQAPNLCGLFWQIIASSINVIGWFPLPIQQKILNRWTATIIGPILHTNIFSVTHQNNTYFRCETENCHKKISVRADTVLFNSKMSFRRWVLMLYCFTKLTWTYGQSEYSVCNFWLRQKKSLCPLYPNTHTSGTNFSRALNLCLGLNNFESLLTLFR